MKTQTRRYGWIRILAGLGLLLSLIPGVGTMSAQAHGEAGLSVSPTVAAPGDSILVRAEGVEAGEVFTITLEGMDYQAPLGTVQVSGEDFEQRFTLPDDLPADNYLIRATSQEGEQITAELTLSAADPQPEATPTGEEMPLERERTPGQLAAIITAIILSGALGLVLIGKRE